MSIDFHEAGPSKESFERVAVEILPPSNERGWSLAFDTQNPDEREAYDRAIDGILKIEMLHPHLNPEISTDTHHEWEMEDSSMLSSDAEEVKEYLNGVINRVQDIVKAEDLLRRAA